MPQAKLYSIIVSSYDLPTKAWYYHQKGKIFRALLIAKENVSGLVTPQFLVVDYKDGKVTMPVIFKTIPPINCEVMHEEIIETTIVSEVINYKKAA